MEADQTVFDHEERIVIALQTSAETERGYIATGQMPAAAIVLSC